MKTFRIKGFDDGKPTFEHLVQCETQAEAEEEARKDIEAMKGEFTNPTFEVEETQ